MTNQKQIREAFWEAHPMFTRRPGWTQNDYPTDVRVAFVFYIDHLERDGEISGALAGRATL